VPGLHGLQEGEPGEEDHVPGWQEAHAVNFVDEKELVVPTGHSAQATDDEMFEKKPANTHTHTQQRNKCQKSVQQGIR
jgi:hypothetical protein